MTRSSISEEGAGSLPRKTVAWPVVLVVLAIGAAFAYNASKSRQAPITASNPAANSTTETPTKSQADPSSTPQERPGVRERSSHKTGANPNAHVSGTQSASAVGKASAESVSTASAASASQLMTRLTQIDLSRGAMTADQARELNQNFKQLAAQGAAAVPVIRQFLGRNQDVMFKDVNGGNVADYPSLRVGLLDVLKQVGGSAALDLSHDTLQTTADPLEIALLSRNLEAIEPGQHRQEALNAARESLAQAASGQLGTSDVGPLFAVLETYGDASVIDDLEKALPKWNYYATMALAGLPDGQGIPVLVRQVQDPAQAGTANVNFELQILAQLASQHPEAGAALLDQARLNQISDSGWEKIAIGLAGAQYQLTNPLSNVNFPPVPRPGLTSYHIHDGNQNFFSSSVWETGSGQQRLALINQLLGATSNPAAIQALQQARTTLTSLLAK